MLRNLKFPISILKYKLQKFKEDKNQRVFDFYHMDEFICELSLELDKEFDLNSTVLFDPVFEQYLVDLGFDSEVNGQVKTENINKIQYVNIWRDFIRIGEYGNLKEKNIESIVINNAPPYINGEYVYDFNTKRKKINDFTGIEDFESLDMFRTEALDLEKINLSYNYLLEDFHIIYASYDINISLPDKNLKSIWFGDFNAKSPVFEINQNSFLTRVEDRVYFYKYKTLKNTSNLSKINGLGNLKSREIDISLKSIVDFDLNGLHSDVKKINLFQSGGVSLNFNNSNLEELQLLDFGGNINNVNIISSSLKRINIEGLNSSSFNINAPRLMHFGTLGILPYPLRLDLPSLTSVSLSSSGFDSFNSFEIINPQQITGIGITNGQKGVFWPDKFYMSSLKKFKNLESLYIQGFKEIQFEKIENWEFLKSLRIMGLEPDYSFLPPLNFRGSRDLSQIYVNTANIDLSPLKNLPYLQVSGNTNFINLNNRQFIQYNEMINSGQLVNSSGSISPPWNSNMGNVVVNSCFFPGEYTILGTDDYGDGWNNASIAVNTNTNGTNVFTTFKVDAAQKQQSFNLRSGGRIYFSFEPGEWDNEISFTIKGPDGKIISNYSSQEEKPQGSIECDCNY
mgnify:FL=1